jgi:hypothetical protein
MPTKKLSKFQAGIMKSLQAGAWLFHDKSKGVYAIRKGIHIFTVDRRAVDVLIQQGLIRFNLLGTCVLTNPDVSTENHTH